MQAQLLRLLSEGNAYSTGNALFTVVSKGCIEARWCVAIPSLVMHLVTIHVCDIVAFAELSVICRLKDSQSRQHKQMLIAPLHTCKRSVLECCNTASPSRCLCSSGKHPGSLTTAASMHHMHS